MVRLRTRILLLNKKKMKFPGKHIKEETPMINKLIANIKKTGAPIVVGLDPMLNYIPKQIQEAAFKEFGETLEGAAEAIWQYNKGIVDARSGTKKLIISTARMKIPKRHPVR